MSSADTATTTVERVSRSRRARTGGLRHTCNDHLSVLPTAEYLCLESSIPVSEAIEDLKSDASGCAIVCEAGHPVGRFTPHDVLTRIVGEKVDLSMPVSMFMSSGVEGSMTLRTDSPIAEAVRAMNDTGCWSIPLIDEAKMAGAISVFDIISYISESYPKESVNLPPVPAQVMDRQEGG